MIEWHFHAEVSSDIRRPANRKFLYSMSVISMRNAEKRLTRNTGIQEANYRSGH